MVKPKGRGINSRLRHCEGGIDSRQELCEGGIESRQDLCDGGRVSRQEAREGDQQPPRLDGVNHLSWSLEDQVLAMKSWQDQVTELKDLLERQQLTSDKRWSGYFSTQVHSYGRVQHDRRGGREEEGRPSKEQATPQRGTGDGAGNVTTTREFYQFWKQVRTLLRWCLEIGWRQLHLS